ncbi:MAG: hypothetical protein B7733_12945 [Myxococcales bacterium FL481]|nr:MAG: hypothetical protein B7733_12945 [Myxococcales bacterium FL481]
MFVGAAGTGKTCAALCVLDWAACGRKYWTMAELCTELISVQAGEREYGQVTDSPRWWWERYAERGLVCIDEIGARENVSDFHYETLKRAMDSREGKPVVLISNEPIDRLARIYDDRVASRMAGGTVIEFGGPDQRLTQ